MKIFLISIFPEIFESFLNTSLIQKAQDKGILEFEIINPRDFCVDKHKQVDDEIYGGGAGMLIKAQPIIDAVESVIEKDNDFKIIFPTPSKDVFCQKDAHGLSKEECLIFVCGRYEGIDHRFQEYLQDKYPDNFIDISLGKFITLGGELPTMTIIESITRLIPGVIKESESRQDESYSIKHNMENIEYPQYTRPNEVYGYKVPDVLLNGNHAEIDKWKEENSIKFPPDTWSRDFGQGG